LIVSQFLMPYIRMTLEGGNEAHGQGELCPWPLKRSLRTLRQHRPSTAAGEAGHLRDTSIYAIIDTEWPAIRERLSM
jgi:hypothetical protein